MNINYPQPSTPYPIPDNPVYDPNIRQLLNDDDAEASSVFNPLIQTLINNTHSVKMEAEAEILTLTLTNTQTYPFNDSKKAVSIAERETTDYSVHAEVDSFTGGFVGDIVVTDKAVDGFKLAYTGSATSVTLKIFVVGGYA